MTTFNNIAALSAQSNLRAASALSQRSIAALSSGQRIIAAKDDVAGLAIGTVLRGNVSTLKTALSTAGQAQSLLGVADGALAQIANILSRQKSLAAQASSGTLDASARTFLNQEFQNLKQEIDRLVDSTNFNGIKLLVGLTDAALGKTNITDAVRGENTITLTADATAADYIVINGVVFKEGAVAGTGSGTDTTNAIGIGTGTTSSTFMTNLLAAINNVLNRTTTTVSEATFNALNSAEYSSTAGSTSLRIQARTGGGQNFTIGDGSATNRVAFTAASGGTVAATNRLSIVPAGSNGYDGLSGLIYSVRGTIGDSILSAYAAGTAATGTITVSGGGTNADTLTINGTVITIVTSGATGNQVNLGATSTELAQNLLQFLNSSRDINFSQASYSLNTSTNVITVTYKAGGTRGNSFALAESSTALAVSGANLSGGTAYTGIDVSGLSNNSAFNGTITGFAATYISANRANITVKIGDVTYTASNITTNPTSATFIRLIADKAGGGFFDIQLAAGGATVANQTEANTLASRLNSAVSGLSFYQNRQLTNFNAAGNIYDGTTQVGSLIGARFEFGSQSFVDPKIESVTVTAPASGATDAKIAIVINGESYEATITNATLVKGQRVTFTNQKDPTRTLTFVNGNASLTLSTTSNATAVQAAFKTALGIGTQGNKLNFQVGTDAASTIGVAISSAKTVDLFAGLTLDVLTAAAAATASTTLDSAIAKLTGVRAEVGAFQSRFDFASKALEASIANQDAARGSFLDADIATESTAFASNQVLVQAGIAVLAQANQLPQNLLKLLA